MKFEGIVTEIDGDKAQVCILGDDCDGKCAGCGGCSKANASRTVPALNASGKTVGEKVEVETSLRQFTLITFMVFCLPVLLAAGGYALVQTLTQNRWLGAVAALVGALVGVIACICLNKWLKSHGGTVYKIVEKAVE